MILFERFLEKRYLDRQLSEQREVIAERLSGIRDQLESTLANNLSLINGLAAFITAYPDFT
ncbi:hypothetical protein E3V39_01750 [Gammaproteobacteria bacterium LSUCC0112]|nr:hypothetical protein E3V39_01750 [Gammaproteobacteria bacterium LSUCC0112]